MHIISILWIHIISILSSWSWPNGKTNRWFRKWDLIFHTMVNAWRKPCLILCLMSAYAHWIILKWPHLVWFLNYIRNRWNNKSFFTYHIGKWNKTFSVIKAVRKWVLSNIADRNIKWFNLFLSFYHFIILTVCENRIVL